MPVTSQNLPISFIVVFQPEPFSGVAGPPTPGHSTVSILGSIHHVFPTSSSVLTATLYSTQTIHHSFS
jgi:hypothetical protein